MIDFSTVKKIVIPEGEVKKIEWNGIVLWKASAYEIISGLLSYADWGITDCEYVFDAYNGGHEGGEEVLEGDSWNCYCIHCGGSIYEVEGDCDGNWIDNSYYTDLSTSVLTLYNPENMTETYQITYNPNESELSIPSSKIGWVFRGDSNRATDYTHLEYDGWYMTTADSIITTGGELLSEGGITYSAYCTVTNVYKVSIDGYDVVDSSTQTSAICNVAKCGTTVCGEVIN